MCKETRVGWPLLTVEAEVKGIQRVQMKEVLPWLLCWALHAGPALAALDGPVQNIFSPLTLFQFLCPDRPASRAGSRAGSPIS